MKYGGIKPAAVKPRIKCRLRPNWVRFGGLTRRMGFAEIPSGTGRGGSYSWSPLSWRGPRQLPVTQSAVRCRHSFEA
jgi:hypothetical protein